MRDTQPQTGVGAVESPLPSGRVVQLIPFSSCRLPVGTTRLELVTLGRSVAMSCLLSGQASSATARFGQKKHAASAIDSAKPTPCDLANAARLLEVMEPDNGYRGS